MTSSAVARDSGDGWFTSRVHFCGRFKSYRLCKEQNELDHCQPDIRAIEQAANLEEARDHLTALGFQRVE